MDRSEKWSEHQPEGVVENERCKILWDMTIQCDHVFEVVMIAVEKIKIEIWKTVITKNNYVFYYLLYATELCNENSFTLKKQVDY